MESGVQDPGFSAIATTLATRAPGGKSPLRGALSLFLQAIGSGMSLHPCRPRPLGASLRLAPALRKRFGDLQP
ncbi:hypothetical protein, partial [Enterobacter sp. ENT02]|uniref:hypothetical protein n=1 Tax=Enterobacter sp. ENT02 TaxID=2854767 RepID=UPI001C472061